MRYLVTLASARVLGPSFPWGTSFPWATLLVNLTGCLLIAFVVELALLRGSEDAAWRVIITTGFLGGLTTYSSFNNETLRLFSERGASFAAINFVVTAGGGLLAGTLGLFLAKRFFDTT